MPIGRNLIFPLQSEKFVQPSVCLITFKNITCLLVFTLVCHLICTLMCTLAAHSFYFTFFTSVFTHLRSLPPHRTQYVQWNIHLNTHTWWASRTMAPWQPVIINYTYCSSSIDSELILNTVKGNSVSSIKLVACFCTMGGQRRIP